MDKAQFPLEAINRDKAQFPRKTKEHALLDAIDGDKAQFLRKTMDKAQFSLEAMDGDNTVSLEDNG